MKPTVSSVSVRNLQGSENIPAPYTKKNFEVKKFVLSCRAIGWEIRFVFLKMHSSGYTDGSSHFFSVPRYQTENLRLVCGCVVGQSDYVFSIGLPRKNNDRFEDKLLSTERRDYIHLYLGKSLKTTRHEVLIQLIRHSVFMRQQQQK